MLKSRVTRAALRLASLVAVGSGALLLVADSSDCPDGYAALHYEATFKSTCPSDVAPPEGTLRIDLPADGDRIGALRDALRKAGLPAGLGTSTDHRADDDVCVDTSFTPRGASVSCDDVPFDAPSRTITCRADSTPRALDFGVGKRDLSDAAADAADAASTDAGEALDASADATAPAPDSGLEGPGDAGPIPPAPFTSCTITFTKTP